MAGGMTGHREDDLYRAIRAAVKARHQFIAERISALCDELPQDERRLYGAIMARNELAIALSWMASAKRIWTRQQRKGGR
jgi:hypothetical protein